LRPGRLRLVSPWPLLTSRSGPATVSRGLDGAGAVPDPARDESGSFANRPGGERRAALIGLLQRVSTTAISLHEVERGVRLWLSAQGLVGFFRWDGIRRVRYGCQRRSTGSSGLTPHLGYFRPGGGGVVAGLARSVGDCVRSLRKMRDGAEGLGVPAARFDGRRILFREVAGIGRMRLRGLGGSFRFGVTRARSISKFFGDLPRPMGCIRSRLADLEGARGRVGFEIDFPPLFRAQRDLFCIRVRWVWRRAGARFPSSWNAQADKMKIRSVREIIFQTRREKYSAVDCVFRCDYKLREFAAGHLESEWRRST